jgi:hypothetical protein
MALFERALAWLRRFFADPQGPPDLPMVGVREPNRPKPGGRAASVAVLEPEDVQSVNAISERHRH